MSSGQVGIMAKGPSIGFASKKFEDRCDKSVGGAAAFDVYGGYGSVGKNTDGSPQFSDLEVGYAPGYGVSFGESNSVTVFDYHWFGKAWGWVSDQT